MFARCGFSSFAIEDEEPASKNGNYGVSYDPAEDKDGIGWSIVLRFAKAVDCESELPDARPTTSWEARCEE